MYSFAIYINYVMLIIYEFCRLALLFFYHMLYDSHLGHNKHVNCLCASHFIFVVDICCCASVIS
jgi:hypothetical protein